MCTLLHCKLPEHPPPLTYLLRDSAARSHALTSPRSPVRLAAQEGCSGRLARVGAALPAVVRSRDRRWAPDSNPGT